MTWPIAQLDKAFPNINDHCSPSKTATGNSCYERGNFTTVLSADKKYKGLEERESVPEESEGKFDATGFANYLAPYVLATIGSLTVTAIFVNFILLDY